MKSKIKFVVTAIGLAIALGAFTSQGLAQQGDDLNVGKKGMARLSSKVRVGDRLLKPGMYHVRHLVEGGNHVMSFQSVTMPAGYKEYRMNEDREVARLKCTVEPVDKSVRNTRVKLGRNAAGERVIEEIQIAGEHIKYRF